MRSSVFPLIFAYFVSLISAAKINDRCTRNADCNMDSAYCKVITPSCGAGVCSCLPGFTLRGGQCKRAVYLDAQCDPKQDKCVGENVECSPEKKKCACIYGYKRGLRGNDCIPNLMDKSAGESCYDTSQCFYSLVCIDNVCGCYNGFKPVGDYQCIPREVYDSCKSVEDCQETPNTLCLNGLCACAVGYKAIQYMSNKTAEYRTACISNPEDMSEEGEECNYDQSKPIYCRPPFICTSCGDRNICARRHALMLAANSAYTSCCKLVSLLVPILSAILLATF